MSQVSVSLVRADTNQEFDVELPDDARIADLLPALVKELGLPITGPDGDQIAYELSNKRTGREYQERQTLGEAGTLTGDLLMLTSTFVAGAMPPAFGDDALSAAWRTSSRSKSWSVSSGLPLPPHSGHSCSSSYSHVTLPDVRLG